jgi:tRNA dimethylallyltransferase
MRADYNLIVVLGPTASGKTRLAARFAHALQTELISADTRQVYRDMNIGTGKDYQEYVIDGKQIPYHLIDIIDAGEQYHLHQYMKDFSEAYHLIQGKGMVPVLCGGSGLYIDAILKGYEYASVPVDEFLRKELKPKTHQELIALFNHLEKTPYQQVADISTAKRTIRAIEICSYLAQHKHEPLSLPHLKPIVFGLNPEVELRRKRIEERLHQRLEEGLIQEVESLLDKGVPEEKLAFYGLEYKFVLHFIKGEMSMEALEEKLTISIQQFAKRQMTFFRKMEREGLLIHWIDASLPVEKQLETVLSQLTK